MKITLKPAKGSRFVFSVLPEEIRGRGSARYQGFDIISKGAVKVPRGTEIQKERGTGADSTLAAAKKLCKNTYGLDGGWHRTEPYCFWHMD